MKLRAQHLLFGIAVLSASLPLTAGPGIQYWQKHGSLDDKSAETKKADVSVKTDATDSNSVATKATPASDKKISTDAKKSASTPTQTVVAKSS